MADLNLKKACCGDGIGMLGAISPFRRAIALEFSEDDGLIVGVAQCGKCDDCWKVVCLDADDVVRIYSIAYMPSNSLSYLEKGYSAVGKPAWPIWVPPTTFQIKESQRSTLETLESTVLGKAQSPTIVFSTKHLINGRVLATDLYNKSVADWFIQLAPK